MEEVYKLQRIKWSNDTDYIDFVIILSDTLRDDQD